MSWQNIYFIMVKPLLLVKTSISFCLNLFLAKHIYFNYATLIISKTNICWQNLPTHTSSYLPIHLQIADFDCRNYNVKCAYCKGVVTSICNLIQTRDNDKSLTPNVGIAIAGIF
jgi:hypothetical protein